MDSLIDGLVAQSGEERETLRRLQARLADTAGKNGALDIAYRTLSTPVGTLLLAATEAGLIRVAYEREQHENVLQTLADRISPRILEAPKRLDAVVRELDEYFAGGRIAFDLPLDMSLTRGFRLAVLGHLPQIPYGQTESYAQVALASGSPRAVRAVGTACATNPLPLVVPCHRVVRSDGSMGQYAGGVEAKRMLLELEAAHAA